MGADRRCTALPISVPYVQIHATANITQNQTWAGGPAAGTTHGITRTGVLNHPIAGTNSSHNVWAMSSMTTAVPIQYPMAVHGADSRHGGSSSTADNTMLLTITASQATAERRGLSIDNGEVLAACRRPPRPRCRDYPWTKDRPATQAETPADRAPVAVDTWVSDHYGDQALRPQ
jgi:hypothetical protein